MKKNGQRRCKYIVSGRDESTDNWHTSGYKLCSFPIDLFIYLYETDFIQGLLKKNEKKLARPFNFRFCNIDCIYLIEIEIKDITDTARSASYFDLHLEIDSDGRLRTKLYDKRDDFHFPIVKFPFI
jgi:hypothetical protein